MHQVALILSDIYFSFPLEPFNSNSEVTKTSVKSVQSSANVILGSWMTYMYDLWITTLWKTTEWKIFHKSQSSDSKAYTYARATFLVAGLQVYLMYLVFLKIRFKTDQTTVQYPPRCFFTKINCSMNYSWATLHRPDTSWRKVLVQSHVKYMIWNLKIVPNCYCIIWNETWEFKLIKHFI